MHQAALRTMHYENTLQRGVTLVDLRGHFTSLPGDSHTRQACTTRPQYEDALQGDATRKHYRVAVRSCETFSPYKERRSALPRLTGLGEQYSTTALAGRAFPVIENRDNSAGTQVTSLVVRSRETPTDQVTTPHGRTPRNTDTPRS